MSAPRNSFDAAAARKRCKAYRRRILDISQNVTALHIAPAFSAMEAVDVIYNGLMRRDAQGKLIDTFLMSKGHGCMPQYVILEELGILSGEDIAQYCKPEGRLGAHPDYGTPGIAASTGSLGHGMGMSVGMAYANRLQNDPAHTYVVVSDGEFQEGSTWEAIMMAANLKIDNLTAFLDLNDFSGMDRMSVTHPAFYPVIEKARAFGWEAHEVNGHDAQAIFDASQKRVPGKPLLVVCKTVKGKGVSFMEHVPIWHYRSPNKQEYEQAVRELTEIAS
ncbi:MAG: transketolase [Alphaproteobacteria bacterium]